MPLHLTKVAFGSSQVDELEGKLRARAAEGPLFLTTRYLPKRSSEIAGEAGGSLYWIIRHRLVARSAILSFGEAEGGRVAINIAPDLVAIQPVPRRAHQGWRYLEDADAPSDMGSGEANGISALPPALIGRLAELCLI